ncbi:Chloroperoxidase [Xylariaceae sp. FL0662B]|nr:Chloroperoxidase [Xylariaceae sp. FL0662B]
MKLLFLIPLAILQSASAKSCPFSIWKPAGPNDARAPCPMLNTLANHGFLPRDGKDITENQTVAALGSALNIEEPLSRTLHQLACMTNLRHPNSTTFSLSDLNNHNILEHDASLSRQDFYFGNVQPFNQTVFDETRSYWKGPIIDVQMGANARSARLRTSNATNPTFTMSDIGTAFSFGETAAYIVVLGDKVSGTVEKSWVEYLFENERLPLDLGWDKPKDVLSGEDLNNITERVMNATNATSNTPARMLKVRDFHLPH